MILDSIIIITSLLFSAFFSGMEIAYISANRMLITLEAKNGKLKDRILEKLAQQPSKFIATMLVGNNIALVIYGIYMGKIIIEFLFPEFKSEIPLWVLVIQTLISTILILITAEFFPKIIFNIYSNQLLRFFIIPIYIIFKLFLIISSFIITISNAFLKLFGINPREDKNYFDKSDLKNLIIEEIDGVHSDELDSEIQIFKNALGFSEVKARECMVPRSEIIAVDITESIENLKQLFVETGLSKIIVYKDTIDDIIGYVHSFELFKKPAHVQDILRLVSFVPETVLVNDVLKKMTKERRSIAVVIDEYGGTSGLITTEDIIEELFGEIEDEHDTPDLIESVLEENRWLFSARLEVDYLNDKYNLEIQKNDSFETLGGFIMFHNEDIPEVDEKIETEEYTFTIKEVSSNKIELVDIQVNKKE